ncbi:heterokaryon incompatibility protein-domain-containing protein [Aspergillus pseudonomiae]|nr:heterokaryon incompatibility protein-domain-containing protein [Aspergillus pseudonomiae]
MQADTFSTLGNIQRRTSSSIVSTLLDLQEHGIFDERTSDWIENLEIIYPGSSCQRRKRRWNGEIVCDNDEKKRLRRAHVNAHGQRKYVAVSYTWKPLSTQLSSHGSHLVESRDGRYPRVSQVRDQVFNRVIAYVNYLKDTEPLVWGFWIDQECIDQKNEAKKQRAIQSMEHVYAKSAFPVALLSVRIQSEDHLEDLVYLLKRESPPRNRERGRVTRILNLLDYITSDPWWKRAWTFQEDYCSSVRMCLLIPYSSALQDCKRKHCEIFGDLDGELCITSADFRSQATEFCMDYGQDRRYKTRCEGILDRAAKYNVQLLERGNDGQPTVRRSMSPLIFSNVGKRKITCESDRLAVIANCLGYSVRLNTKTMDQKNCSLSIAMLALFILNGEILMNGPDNPRDAVRSTIFEYLTDRSLHNFQIPDINQKLTFIKNCRFPEVHLSEEGILTSGHLWRLGKIVRDPRTTREPHKGQGYELNSYQRMRLKQLARHLESGACGRRYKHIASAIDEYLEKDKTCGKAIAFAKYYKDLMAEEVVKAMDDRPSDRLRLGSLIPAEGRSGTNPYCGVFARESGNPWAKEQAYIFTAVRSPETSPDGIEKHVSLEVELLSSPRNGPKRLIIQRWINGLFFFDAAPRIDVVFPWPKSLLG